MNDDMTSEYSLLDDPWVKCRLLDGHICTLSVRDLIRVAPSIHSIRGESPQQDAAVLRMLIAVILRAVGVYSTREDAIDGWQEYWSSWDLLVARVEDYLTPQRERWFLRHPRYPFMQAAGLRTDSGRRSGLNRLVPGLGEFFSSRGGAEAVSVGWDEAARWLVYRQAYDEAGIKTGAADDPATKGGKGYSFFYPAWTGNLGLVVIEGENLAQTLLLNSPFDRITQGDAAIWESDFGHRANPNPRSVRGPADLMTWSSRRILLHWEAGRVCDVQVSNGDKLEPYNWQHLEPMSTWRISANQTAKLGRTIYRPIEHVPERQIWRGLMPMLSKNDQERPSTLDWLSRLALDGVLPQVMPIRLRTTGVSYGTQNSVIATTIDDVLDGRIAALVDSGLASTIDQALTCADEAAKALGGLEVDLLRILEPAAATERRSQKRNAAEASGFAALDYPFRSWFSGLTDNSLGAMERAAGQWQRRVYAVVRELGGARCRDAGARAVIGRLDASGHRRDTAFVWTLFITRLQLATPMARRETPIEQEDLSANDI